MKTPNKDLIASLEALLFLYGDSGIKRDALLEILADSKPSIIDQALSWLIDQYQTNSNSGLMIQRYNKDYYRLCVKPGLSEQLGENHLISTEINLSPTMIEVATIVAYKGPLTRRDLDKFRGIDSSFILNKLRELNLVKHQGYKSNTRAHLYVVTDEFFKVFNLTEGLDSLISIKSEDLEVLETSKIKQKENLQLFDQLDK